VSISKAYVILKQYINSRLLCVRSSSNNFAECRVEIEASVVIATCICNRWRFKAEKMTRNDEIRNKKILLVKSK
jgi:hypothetical protein